MNKEQSAYPSVIRFTLLQAVNSTISMSYPDVVIARYRNACVSGSIQSTEAAL